jgi:hypothetical protein
MKIRLGVALFSVCVLSAQTPNLSGVWKANLEKSKFSGPPPSNYLVVIDQQGPKITETVGNFGRMGEQRSSFTYSTGDEKPSMNSFRGLPMRTKASWEGGALVLESKVAGAHAASIREKYELAADGNTLTVNTVTTVEGKENQQTLVLEKQPDSAGEPLRKPEQTAAEHFKNVQILKDLPASRFIDAMRSFSMSLGVECDHCHAQGNFASDDKPAKGMARKMLIMTHGINDQTFGGKMVVRCYTCHRGQVEPQSTPAF